MHLNCRIWMFAKLGVLGFRDFVQTPFRERIHLWNSQLDVRPDFCAWKIEAWGLRVMIQTQLHCLYILGWLLPPSGFLLVNTSYITKWERERAWKQATGWKFKLGVNILGREFYGLQVSPISDSPAGTTTDVLLVFQIREVGMTY